MEKIALAVFGTSDGTDAYISPKTFTLPDPPHRVIDTSFPFLAHRDVFRYYRVRGAERDLVLLAIYTKVDDFGGPRDGAFAGAGVFVRNATVDSQLLVAVLKDLLGGLVAAATQDGRFVCKVSEAMAEGRIRPPAQASALADSTSDVIQSNFSTGISGARQLIAADDLLITDAVSFFHCVQINPEWFGNDVFFSRDPEIHRACGELTTINTVTVRSLKERWVVDHRNREDALINQLNAARSELKASFESRSSAIEEAVSYVRRENANEVAALQQKIQSLTTARDQRKNWVTDGTGSGSFYTSSASQNDTAIPLHGTLANQRADEWREPNLRSNPISQSSSQSHAKKYDGSHHQRPRKGRDTSVRRSPRGVGRHGGDMRERVWDVLQRRWRILTIASIFFALALTAFLLFAIPWAKQVSTGQTPKLSQPVAAVTPSQPSQFTELTTAIATAPVAPPKPVDTYDFSPSAAPKVRSASELAAHISSTCNDPIGSAKSVEDQIIQDNKKDVSENGAFHNKSSSVKILVRVPEGCDLPEGNGFSSKGSSAKPTATK